MVNQCLRENSCSTSSVSILWRATPLYLNHVLVNHKISALQVDGRLARMTSPSLISRLTKPFRKQGLLHPGRLLRQDLINLKRRYSSDWTLFNQQIFASAVYVFFTNLLPGITFASDLYVLTGKSWGTIEVVLSTGLCGVGFALWVVLSLLLGSGKTWEIRIDECSSAWVARIVREKNADWWHFVDSPDSL